MKTKGELITACVKLMYDNDTEMIDTTTVSENPEYSSRTVNIIESINRAFSEVAKAEYLPKKKIIIDLDVEFVEKDEYYTKYDLSKLADDIYKINNITFQDGARYYSNIGIRLEGEYTLVLKTVSSGKYIVTYNPMFSERLSYEMPDTQEILTVPEDIIDIVPYFVKGDLYEDDDPDTALMSTNKFHSYLANRPRQGFTQTKIKTVYSQVW